MGAAELRSLRRRGGFSMVFQDPLSHLNPTHAHRPRRSPKRCARASTGTRRATRVAELLREVGLPDAARVRRARYPHELSGGMRQRVLIAIALASEPRLLFADEPTTSLDATVQLQVLETLRRLHRERNMALRDHHPRSRPGRRALRPGLCHDRRSVRRRRRRVHPVRLAATPLHRQAHRRGAAAPAARRPCMTPILSGRAVTKSFVGARRQGWRRETIRAVDAVDLDVHEGETLAVVGESGSGKSTLARVLLGLSAPTSGEVLFRGRPTTALTRQDRHVFRREIQPVFQDPAASLNPRMRIETTLAHVLLRHRLATAQTLRTVIIAQLEAVGLVPGDHYLGRYPHELSGGQQQRVAIARALAVRPKLLIADEPLSSLDMSVQAQVLDLLIELRRRFHLGLVLISHDLNVVETIADRIAVMNLGKIVETGATVDVMRCPQHVYTRTLLNARLVADPRLARRQRMNQ